MRRAIFVTGLAVGLLFLSGLGFANEVLHPTRVEVKPKIDGELDDETWQIKWMEKDFTSYVPRVGETSPHKTRIWMAYDKDNLYFAFLCYDPDPGKIKTSISKRDEMYNDDWVGLALDTLGTKQTAWGLFINPNGIQGDMVASAASESSSGATDLEWESAGKVTDKGYQVEIAIPLKNIIFKSGKEVKMGILFWRNLPSAGVRTCWPLYVPGGKVFGTQTPIIYKDLKRPLKLEVLPTFVVSPGNERVNPGEWGDWDTPTHIGLGVKYGITSTITADISVNPDFSQVAPDPFRTEFNQRYPVFYQERRPFFMEGMDIFNFFTIPIDYSGFCPNAVYTRRIMDPGWSAKLTGTAGKTAFGILTAGDKQPGQAWQTGENPNEGKHAFWGIARGKYVLGGDTYVGLLYSGREFAGEYNRVFGADARFRLFKKHTISASAVHSTSGGGPDDIPDSSMFNLMYFHMTKNTMLQTGFEHIGTDFRMDSAFIRRTGTNSITALAKYIIIPNPKKINWITAIETFAMYHHIHDLNEGTNDHYLTLTIEPRFRWHAFTGIRYFYRAENWMGQTFNQNQFFTFVDIQVTHWLRLHGEFTWGDGIYYEGAPPFKGRFTNAVGRLNIQPSEKCNVLFELCHTVFKKDNQKVYDIDLINSRLTYQFNKHLALRAMALYDSYRKVLLTDVLVSFAMIPNTILYAGYGGLYENRQWQNNNWLYGQGDLLHVKNSFFAKMSYQWHL